MNSIVTQFRAEPYVSQARPTKISDDPDEYHSHFVQLTAKTSKGQARYRCVTCAHEFSCSGKRRKLQHILGRDFLLGKCKNRNVVPCPHPHEPLKRALLSLCKLEGNECLNKLTSGSLITRPSSFSSSSGSSHTARPTSGNDEHDDSEFNSVIQDILSWGNEPGSDHTDPSQSFYSNCSESSDEGEVPSPKRVRSAYNIMSPNASFYVNLPRVNSTCSTGYSSPHTVPVTPRAPLQYTHSFHGSFQPTTTTTLPPQEIPHLNSFAAIAPQCLAPEPVRTASFQQTAQPPAAAPPTVTPKEENRTPILNQAIFNFFSAYQIPLSALESPAFQEMVQHVQLEDSVIQDMNMQVDQIHFN